MKKSNPLMLAYCIFLFTTIIASVFSWDGLPNIACGATIAGCAFSFADLINRYVSYYSQFIDPYKETISAQLGRALLLKKDMNEQIEDANKAIEILQPYRDDDRVRKVTSSTEEFINKTKGNLSEVDALLNDTYIPDRIKCMEKNIEQLEKKETWFLMAGYILFFCVIVFNCVEKIVQPFLSALTVLAFAIIVLNYYLHDILENKANDTISEIKRYTNVSLREIENMKLEMKTTSFAEKAKLLIEEYISKKKKG